MIMRKFYLENEQGQRKTLQGTGVFFHRPQGLGFASDIEYFESADAFFVEANKQSVQPNVFGNFVFLKDRDPYMQYAELVDWLSVAESLTLIYQPAQYRELLMDVDLESVDLTEKTEFGVLECPVSFKGKTPYYKRMPETFVFTSEPGEAKRYTYSYPFKYGQTGKGSSVEVFNSGHFPASVIFEARGPIARPILKATNLITKETIGALDLSGVSVSRQDTMLFSSRPNETGVWRVTNGRKVDLISQINLANNNFFTIPENTPVEVSFWADVDPAYEGKITHHLELYEYFRG